MSQGDEGARGAAKELRNHPLAEEGSGQGTELLDAVRASLERYVVLPSVDAVIAVTLWVAATHGVDQFEHATRLAVHSPVKRCGKSRLLEVLSALVHKALQTTNISVPALFRMIEGAGEYPPTLLLDEADQIFGSAKKDEQSADLVAALNNGFRRGSPTYRCAGPKHEVRRFSNFAFAAIAGIGRLPGTIEDRAINVTMRRSLPGEQVSKFRLRTDLPRLQELGTRLGVWIQSVNLSDEIDVPSELEDRAADAWEPLLAVADAAGGEWPRLAREAAIRLSRDLAEATAGQSLDIRLLADMKMVMQDSGFLATRLAIERLRELEDAPWDDMGITGRRLSMMLAKFGVEPKRDASGSVRGYHSRDFRDPFSRYLPSEASGVSGAAAEQGACADALGLTDGTTRQADGTCQPKTPAEDSVLTELTLLSGLVPVSGQKNGNNCGPVPVHPYVCDQRRSEHE